MGNYHHPKEPSIFWNLPFPRKCQGCCPAGESIAHHPIGFAARLESLSVVCHRADRPRLSYRHILRYSGLDIGSNADPPVWVTVRWQSVAKIKWPIWRQAEAGAGAAPCSAEDACREIGAGRRLLPVSANLTSRRSCRVFSRLRIDATAAHRLLHGLLS